MNTEDYDRFCKFLEKVSGITLGRNKAYLVRSRLNRIIGEFQGSLSNLVDTLEKGVTPALRARVVDAMTTNETLWFRDAQPFEALKEIVLPELSGLRGQPVRIWSAACSSGQEPYSISMAISEHLLLRPGAFRGDAEILGTDIAAAALKQAKSGLYGQFEAARGLSEERRARFFTAVGDQLKVKDEIRRRVTYQEFNLLHSFTGLGSFDVVFCRNVLIYFSNETKIRILAKIGRQLRPNGFLFLGGSEPIANYSDAFEMIRHGRGVVYRLK